VLERGDEREFDRLALFIAGLGPGDALGEAKLAVWDWLDLARFQERRPKAVMRVGRRPIVHRQNPGKRSLVDHSQADVGRDRVQPRPQRAAGFETGERPPCPQQGFLHGVIGVVDRAEHLVAVRVQLAAVRFDERCVGPFVSVACRVEQLRFIHRVTFGGWGSGCRFR
jgi:hypothetical protein